MRSGDAGENLSPDEVQKLVMSRESLKAEVKVLRKERRRLRRTLKTVTSGRVDFHDISISVSPDGDSVTLFFKDEDLIITGTHLVLDSRKHKSKGTFIFLERHPESHLTPRQTQ